MKQNLNNLFFVNSFPWYRSNQYRSGVHVFSPGSEWEFWDDFSRLSPSSSSSWAKLFNILQTKKVQFKLLVTMDSWITSYFKVFHTIFCPGKKRGHFFIFGEDCHCFTKCNVLLFEKVMTNSMYNALVFIWPIQFMFYDFHSNNKTSLGIEQCLIENRTCKFKFVIFTSNCIELSFLYTYK